MAEPKKRRREGLSPQTKSFTTRKDLLDFVELDGFSAEWRDLGLDDEDLFALQMMILANPRRAPVIRQSGGLRKIRFAPPRWRAGASGAIRVCYVYFEEHSIVFLVVAFAKNEKADLSSPEL